MQKVSKIISGGQTGSDMGGLIAGQALGITTGGTAPKGWRTENGSNPALEDFGLHQSTLADYATRTRRNVENSDLTVIVSSDAKSAGTKLTIDACRRLNKQYVLVDPIEDDAVDKVRDAIRDAIKIKSAPVCVNVAGNRESKSPGIEKKTTLILIQAIK